jgi:hypothetical protein
MKIKTIELEMDTASTLHSLASMAVEKLGDQAIGCLLASMAQIARKDEAMFHKCVINMAALAASYIDDAEFVAGDGYHDLEPEFLKAREQWKEARLEHQIDEARNQTA